MCLSLLDADLDLHAGGGANLHVLVPDTVDACENSRIIASV